MEKLLIEAKNNNYNAKEEIINMYYPLIIKESKKIFLKNRTFEDLVQIGIMNLLKAIKLYDLSRGTQSFSSYALWSIKNGYISILRSEIKYNEEVSLNNFCKDSDIEIVDSLIDEKVNIEYSIIKDFSNIEIIEAFKKLDQEEQDILTFLYIKNDKANLSKYCRLRNKDYYYCSKLKIRTLQKLKFLLRP
ncbi:sigma-70 family RNA polymerase sigma factor [Clostridium sp. Sa3CUN1]|uniref:Sigma-70 family RNA polymerase sigma factor n=1 Tax=Clostridium gallinarum TaxID=2762246 RepID=A0ABR8Q2V1_9CLOT|nr:sigma-70 family RNA polymerase sigma factor [Clostridium gallinarum]MBD7914730.1 sigma-70 family RNA polymerase sigma factor [Clostridium gallinarum]